MIDLKTVIREIAKKDYRDGNGNFRIGFMLCNRDQETGGEILFLDNACGCGLPPHCKGKEMRGIKDMDTGKPYPVHNRLIFQYQGQEVYWV